ncbi:MAG: hypothetical protein U5K00_23985 [Melioribacteraceae bacterium]|nr:hypothetical protein [Melioribacteraceae bacterium]
MKDIDRIINLHKKKSTSKVLKYGSTEKIEIKALQRVLNDLGFGRELKWDKYNADGYYGDCTLKAVENFCDYNKIRASGKSVSLKAAEKIIERYELIDELKILNEALKQGEIETRIKLNGRYKTGIAAMQTLLAELGYKRQLKWNKYGADGEFGKATTSALKKYSEDEGYLDSGEALTEKLAESIISKFKNFYGSQFMRETNKIAELTETISGRNVIISDGNSRWTFRKYRQGLFTFGKNRPKDFIETYKPTLTHMGLNSSAINVMISVSENEGNLDAVNTWDNAFLSFGMYQWTLGTSTNPGELPALLKKIKLSSPTSFDQYFLSKELDVHEADDTTGYLSLNGRRLGNAHDKEKLRTHEWTFRFWKAGQDEKIQAIQIEHAYKRLNLFYKSIHYRVDEFYISDLVKSEYGVALLLDNHVNRPGYLVDTLKKTLNSVDLGNPKNWGTEEEKKFLKEYLAVRKSFGKHPMTDADGRAAVTKKFVRNNIISDERGSFSG